MNRLLALVLLVAGLAPAHAARRVRALDAIAAKLEPTRSVVYKQVGGRDLMLHIFNPAGHKKTDRRAAIVVIHGGGWTGGTPRWFYPISDHFAKLGVVGISIEYRLLKKGTNVTVFDCVRDGRSAIRYVRQHAAELGIDPDRIIASGGSAGGHVAAGTALFENVNEAGEDLTISAIPNALVLLYPVIDTGEKGYGQKKIGERWKELSPVDNVRAGLPPTLIFHGDGDTVTPYAGAALFHQRMLEAGNDSILITHPGGVHGYLIFDLKLYEEGMLTATRFLQARGLIH